MLSGKQIEKIGRAQSTAIKLINPQLSLSKIISTYSILKFEDMIGLEQCKWGYKLTHNLLPIELKKNMTLDHKRQTTKKTHRYPTQKQNNSQLTHVVGNKYRNSFLFQSISQYAAVCETAKESPTLASFTHKCKQTLLAKYNQ